jgi:hypothetical protein
LPKKAPLPRTCLKTAENPNLPADFKKNIPIDREKTALDSKKIADNREKTAVDSKKIGDNREKTGNDRRKSADK